MRLPIGDVMGMVGSDSVTNRYIRDLISFDGVTDRDSKGTRERAVKILMKEKNGKQNRENFFQLLHIIFKEEYHNKERTGPEVRKMFNFYTRTVKTMGKEGFTTSDGRTYSNIKNIKMNTYFSWNGNDQQKFANWINQSPLKRN